MNNTIIVDNQGLFIYIDIGYSRLYYDVTILQHFDIYANWHNHFAHIDEYFEYLFGDLGYMGKENLSCNGLVATNGVWIHTRAR
jgi:hypothetical protein